MKKKIYFLILILLNKTKGIETDEEFDTGQVKDNRKKDNIILTSVIQNDEIVIFDENLELASNLIENYTKNSDKNFKIGDYNNYIFYQLKDYDSSELKNLFIEDYNRRFDITFIFDKPNENLISIETRKYEIIEEFNNENEGDKEYSIKVLENKNRSVFTYYKQHLGTNLEYFKFIDSFFHGCLIVFIKYDDNEDWEFMFHYQLNGLNGFFSYSDIEMKYFNEKINSDLQKKKVFEKSMKLDSDVLNIKILPIRKYILDYDYDSLIFTLKVKNHLFVYKISKNNNYMPALIKYVEISKKNLLQILKVYQKSSPNFFCEEDLIHVLYNELYVKNFITNIDLFSLLNNNFNSKIQINCKKDRNMAYIYNLENNQISGINSVRRREINVLTFDIFSDILFESENLNSCLKLIHAELTNFYVVLCWKNPELVTVYRSKKTREKYFKQLHPLYDLNFSVKNIYTVNYSNDVIIIYNEVNFVILYFHSKYLKIQNVSKKYRNKMTVLESKPIKFIKSIQQDGLINENKNNFLFKIIARRRILKGINKPIIGVKKKIKKKSLNFPRNKKEILPKNNIFSKDKLKSGIELDNKLIEKNENQLLLKNDFDNKIINNLKLENNYMRDLFLFLFKEKIYNREITYLKFLDNIQLSFEITLNIFTDYFIKGNLLKIDMFYFNIQKETYFHKNKKDTKEKFPLNKLELTKKFQFLFDDIYFFYSFYQYPFKDIKSINDLKKMKISFFLKNKEYLFYLKKNISKSYFIKENKKNDNILSLKSLNTLFYCNIKKKIYLKSIIIFQCQSKDEKNEDSFIYYYFDFTTNNQDLIYEFSICNSLSVIGEYNVIICKNINFFKLFHFDLKTYEVNEIKFGMDSHITYSYLSQYTMYLSDYFSSFIIFYTVKSEKTTVIPKSEEVIEKLSLKEIHQQLKYLQNN